MATGGGGGGGGGSPEWYGAAADEQGGGRIGGARSRFVKQSAYVDVDSYGSTPEREQDAAPELGHDGARGARRSEGSSQLAPASQGSDPLSHYLPDDG